MRTKIVCTIGPASNTAERLQEFIAAGMAIARVNCTHGALEKNEETIRLIQQVRNQTKSDIKVMLDTKGPDVRIGFFKDDEVEVIDGQVFTIYTQEMLGNVKGCFANYDRLPQIVRKGQELRLNDGMVIMKVMSTTPTSVIARVVVGGKLKNRKSLAVPGCDLQIPFISREDEIDLAMGCKNDVDMIAASFVSSAKDVLDMKALLRKYGKDIPIISKIESVMGVENIDEILKVTEGIMVARGDLGVEYPIEQIPALQKYLVEKAQKAGRMVIVATEMLESMIEKPRPTRAETTDIANAVWDGTDYVMLSGETSVGRFPLQCIHYMRKIAEEAEKNTQYYRKYK